MKKALVLLLSFFSVSSAYVSAATLVESNTVKSSELITDFAVIKDASDAQVIGVFTLYKAGSGDRGPSVLATSADETITMFAGDQSVVCTSAENCRIPYIPGVPYRVELKRFNGEVFSAITEIPNETRILTPNDNSFFDDKSPIEFSWVVAKDNGPRGIALSVFLDDQITTCSTTGNIDWKTEGTAVAPAKYVSTCQLPLRARFAVFYVNPVLMRGVAGGTLKGYSTARINFTYMENGTSFQRVRGPLTREEALDFLGSVPKAQTSTQRILR